MYLDAMHNALKSFSRREALGLGLGAAAGLAAGGALAGSHRGAARLDLSQPRDNILAFAKTWGTIGDEVVYGGHEGVFFAVVGNRHAIPLFGYVGFGSLQFRILENGDALYRGKDATYYTDLATGQVMDSWKNPWTGETCRVYPYINDRVRTTIPTGYPAERFDSDHYRWEITIGNAAETGERRSEYRGDIGESGETKPFVLPWRRIGNQYLLSWDWMLEVSNPVTPERFPDSSTGPVINPSEHFVFFVPAAELEDQSSPWAPMTAGFFRQTPWLPWMKMGRSGIDGRMFANSHSYKLAGGLDNIPRVVREKLERERPDMLDPPTDWEPGPVGTTWSYYAKVAPPET
jgi:hypothetical protein